MNKNLKLFLVLIVLAALAWIYAGPFQSFKNKLSSPKNFLSKVRVEKLEKIEIKGGRKDVVLKKEGERWKIDGTRDFYVEDSLAKNMIEELEKAVDSDLELASSNKEKKNRFQTGEGGVKVKLIWDEDKDREFVVGKMTPDFNGTYIAEVEGEDTYSVRSKLSGLFNYAEWYDKTIFNADNKKISKIRFQYPNKEFTIEKVEDKWEGTIPYKFEVSEEKANEVLGVMSRLRAASIPEQTFENTDLDKHLMIIQATGEGLDNTLMIGKENEEGFFYAKKSDNDNIYLISKTERDKLDRDIWSLK